jgi:hypothetical protein
VDSDESNGGVVDLEGQAHGSFVRGSGYDEIRTVGEVVGGGLGHADEALVDVGGLHEDREGDEAVEP